MAAATPGRDSRGFTGPDLALWGGVECTVTRVGDRWRDQIARTGHADRLDDLDRVAALGIRTLRYPLLWERLAPDGWCSIDWGWADRRMERLRELGIRPIVGLVHHGGGPRGVDLLSPGFAPGLAAFARAVAERYPWVDAWTPVNEPLTTARFAALYGYWRPHARDARAFIRALVNQCRAVRLAMREIRQVNPNALLVQTEDLGKTWSTPPLAYQADYENERRWLSLDLLCGDVGRDHPLWAHLWWLGLQGDDLFPFLEDPCPPDVLGFNYYLTSERFLDHRLDAYPGHPSDGNGRDRYVDVEAVRVRVEGVAGPEPLLREAWARYRRPLAITEAHLGCTREEQLRWLAAAWNGARRLRADGVDVRAVTVWSLFGAYDWHSLLTRDERRYEPGAFDLRAPEPRPTALASLAAELACGAAPSHPLAAQPGWWERASRLIHPPWPAPHPESPAPRQATRPRSAAGGLLVVGANGPLGRAVLAACRQRGIPARPLRTMRDPADAARAIAAARPWAVFDARLRRAGPWPRGDPATFARLTTRDAAALAAACADANTPLAVVSSARVFDPAGGGSRAVPDGTVPACPVGRAHAALEALTLARHPGALVARAGEIVGPEAGAPLAGMLRRLARGRPVVAPDDAAVSVAALPDLAEAVLDALIDGETGVWPLAHPEPLPWSALLRAIAARAGFPGVVRGCPAAELTPARRLPALALTSERGWPMAPLEDALDRLFACPGAADR